MVDRSIVNRQESEVDRLTRQLCDAEAELNDRVYRLFHLTRDKVKLLQEQGGTLMHRSLRDEHARTIEPARRLQSESATLERRTSDLVNQAYALTPAEIALLWQTAPPRMPIATPNTGPEA